MTAAAPLTIMVGTGVIKRLVTTGNLVRGDMIPVDYVANHIIVGSANHAK